MKLRYTKRAFAEREAIYDYLESQNPQGARNVRRAIDQTIGALALFPLLGRQTDITEVRELVVPRFPYKIYYRIAGEEIWILHLRDATRRPLDT